MYSGEEFLNKLYQDLYRSEDVQREIKRYELKGNDRKELGKKNEKLEDISIYLKRLEEGYRSIDSKRKKELLKDVFYDKYVIKEEDIPSYMDKETIIQNQKDSLDKWIDYLTDPNARYEMWAKYWAFQGMLKMGTYDEAKGGFNRRSKKTVNPFIDCNPEVVANCISIITKYVHGEKIDDERLNELVNSGNFSKIYTLFYQKYKNFVREESDYRDGKWIKYNYGSEEDAKRLSKSLENKNTGWCTANEEMAKEHVCGGMYYHGGDFYVYYTKDKDNNYTLPRIAIRMNGTDIIGEIRGVADGQNLEEGLEDILKEKLNSFDFLNENEKMKYLDIINNSKLVTSIKKKDHNNEPLTREESVLLWTKGKIKLFGWYESKQIEKIRRNRISSGIVKYDIKQLNDDEIKNILHKYPYLFKLIDPNDCADYDALALEVVKTGDIVHPGIRHIDPKKVKNYDRIAFEAVKRDSYLIDRIDPKNVDNYGKIALEAVRKNGSVIRFINPKNVDNYNKLAIVAVKQDGLALDSIDPKNVDDYDKIALEAVKQNYLAIECVDPDDVSNYKELRAIAAKSDDYFADEDDDTFFERNNKEAEERKYNHIINSADEYGTFDNLEDYRDDNKFDEDKDFIYTDYMDAYNDYIDDDYDENEKKRYR